MACFKYKKIYLHISLFVYILNTKINLQDRVHSLANLCTDDIVVEIDGKLFNNVDFDYIQKLTQIIDDSGQVGDFQLGNLFITIHKVNTYTKDLIKL